MFALREQVERANADTILVIHDDHFVVRVPVLSAVRAAVRTGGQRQWRHRPGHDQADHRGDIPEIRGQGCLSVGAERHPAAHGQLG
jgi:hypothetical protein